MIFDKRKGSLLNYIQLPLNVITPYGTYLGVGYEKDNTPKYVLSDVRVTTFAVNSLVFSSLSKDELIRSNKPVYDITEDNTVGYNYKISPVEIENGFITVASKRIDITSGRITAFQAEKLLEKQLRNIGNVLEKFIVKTLGQPQFDALLVHFFYEGVDSIEDSSIVKMINAEKWYDITDEIQRNIKRSNGTVDEKLAVRKIAVCKMWSYVPGYS